MTRTARIAKVRKRFRPCLVMCPRRSLSFDDWRTVGTSPAYAPNCLALANQLKKDRMTQDETQKVKLAAKSLLHRLLEESPKVLVQDWYKDSQSQRVVRTAVEQVLDVNLPDTYDRILFKEKCDTVFELRLDYACTDKKWAA